MCKLDTSCKLDLKYYPFDKQTCKVKIRNEVSSYKGNTFDWHLEPTPIIKVLLLNVHGQYCTHADMNSLWADNRGELALFWIQFSM